MTGIGPPGAGWAAGVPWWTYAYTSMFAAIAQDRWAGVSDAVWELTGRPAVPLAEVLARR